MVQQPLLYKKYFSSKIKMQTLVLSPHYFFYAICIFLPPYCSIFLKVSDAECHFLLDWMINFDQALDEVPLGDDGNVHHL